MNEKLSIIGSSEIIKKHIYAAKKNKFKINSIISLNKKNKKSLHILKKKFKIKKTFTNLNKFLIDAKKNKSSVLIAPRISDNQKIMKKVLALNLKTMIEKPVFLNVEKFEEFSNLKKNIFIGYNRIYYKFTDLIKKIKNKKKIYFVNVRCPENKKIDFLKNSCHSISIIYYIFGKLYFVKKISNKKHFLIVFETKKKEIIYFNFELNSPRNFSIEFNFKNKILLAEPIEKFFEINKIKKKIVEQENFYFPVKKLIYNENELDGKPGFIDQYKNFKKFINNKKSKYLNLNDAKNIMTIAKKIYSDV
jgi:hypothetical protein